MNTRSHARKMRARARKRSDGAVMFIVVVTLGLLAAMGVYGLTATQSELVSAGHMREALQAQKAGETTLMMAAETFNPASAKALVEAMSGAKRTTNCRTAAGAGDVPANIAPYVGAVPVPPKAACLRLSEAEMKIVGESAIDNLGNKLNTWLAPAGCAAPSACVGFADDSFGAVDATPTVQVEISNPVDVPPPAGSGYDPASQRFTQVTVTVFVELRSHAAPNTPTLSVVVGRGKMTVGPITGSAASY
jgi:Tfp pilus assembly protein PilX